MKIEYGPEANKSEQSKYPYFGKFTDNDGSYIVLFSSSNTGMIVKSKMVGRPVYQHSHSWSENKFTKLENFSVKFSTD